MYYTENRDECRLTKAYNRMGTKNWLMGMNTFESIVDWWGVKGIFTDDKYNIYDLEYVDNRIITNYKSVEEYQEPWNYRYYQNLKVRIEQYMKKQDNAKL